MSKFELKCEDCGYYWKEEGERYAGCHWESRCPGDIAPCDEDEYSLWGIEEDGDIDDYYMDEI